MVAFISEHWVRQVRIVKRLDNYMPYSLSLSLSPSLSLSLTPVLHPGDQDSVGAPPIDSLYK